MTVSPGRAAWSASTTSAGTSTRRPSMATRRSSTARPARAPAPSRLSSRATTPSALDTQSTPSSASSQLARDAHVRDHQHQQAGGDHDRHERAHDGARPDQAKRVDADDRSPLSRETGEVVAKAVPAIAWLRVRFPLVAQRAYGDRSDTIAERDPKPRIHASSVRMRGNTFAGEDGGRDGARASPGLVPRTGR